MPEQPTPTLRFIARLRAIFEEDWKGQAGAFFRRGMSAISDVNKEHLHLEEKVGETPELAWRAVKGLAEEKHAKSIADYARAENEKIDLALKKRVLDDKVRQEKAMAAKLEAEAALAKINELKARAELARTMSDLGFAITVAEDSEIRIVRGHIPASALSEIYTFREKRELGIIVDIVLPDFGGVANTTQVEVRLVKWLKKVGDLVELDEPIFEISTASLDAEVPSPASGILHEIKIAAGSILAKDAVLGRIEKGKAKNADAASEKIEIQHAPDNLVAVPSSVFDDDFFKRPIAKASTESED